MKNKRISCGLRRPGSRSRAPRPLFTPARPWGTLFPPNVPSDKGAENGSRGCAGDEYCMATSMRQERARGSHPDTGDIKGTLQWQAVRGSYPVFHPRAGMTSGSDTPVCSWVTPSTHGVLPPHLGLQMWAGPRPVGPSSGRVQGGRSWHMRVSLHLKEGFWSSSFSQ